MSARPPSPSNGKSDSFMWKPPETPLACLRELCRYFALAYWVGHPEYEQHKCDERDAFEHHLKCDKLSRAVHKLKLSLVSKGVPLSKEIKGETVMELVRLDKPLSEADRQLIVRVYIPEFKALLIDLEAASPRSNAEETDWDAVGCSIMFGDPKPESMTDLHRMLAAKGYTGSRPSVYNLPKTCAAAKATGIYREQGEKRNVRQGSKSKDGTIEAVANREPKPD